MWWIPTSSLRWLKGAGPACVGGIQSAVLSDLRSKTGHSTHARPIQEGKLKAQADWQWATAAVLSDLRSKTGHSTHARPIQEDKPKAQADWQWATADAALLRSAQCVTAQRALHQGLKVQSSLHFLNGPYALISLGLYSHPRTPNARRYLNSAVWQYEFRMKKKKEKEGD